MKSVIAAVFAALLLNLALDAGFAVPMLPRWIASVALAVVVVLVFTRLTTSREAKNLGRSVSD